MSYKAGALRLICWTSGHDFPYYAPLAVKLESRCRRCGADYMEVFGR